MSIYKFNNCIYNYWHVLTLKNNSSWQISLKSSTANILTTVTECSYLAKLNTKPHCLIRMKAHKNLAIIDIMN